MRAARAGRPLGTAGGGVRQLVQTGDAAALSAARRETFLADRERPSRAESPHRLTDEDLDPADVANVREAISALLATAHDVTETHPVDGVWTAGEPVLEEISTIGLEPSFANGTSDRSPRGTSTRASPAKLTPIAS
ncbi:hypothetical protein [Amycolatopsis circi]|uniref:hypothetical protein n=1 Tax=Amycolatopsis circi TaxID=871959 RepID=UPI000E23AE46|nr:hypothetical protein [Amycolatopsis circi]